MKQNKVYYMKICKKRNFIFTAIFTILAFSFTNCGNQNPTPTAEDFNIGKLSQMKDSIEAVTITPKTGKTGGAITNICYEGKGVTHYDKNKTLPDVSGSYEVTFDVKSSNRWKSAKGLSAGTLLIKDIICGSVTEMSDYLSKKYRNLPSTSYYIALNIDDNDIANLKITLDNSADKYVYLDLSGSTITKIQSGTFNNFLTGINIPNSVTIIKSGSFERCNHLTIITIPDSVSIIQNNAFYGCNSLTSITIPDSVTSIDDGAFSHCSNLTSVTFQGTINSDNFYYSVGALNFSMTPFEGNLRDVFYATDENNGTPGTYTRPDNTSGTWTKL